MAQKKAAAAKGKKPAAVGNNKRAPKAKLLDEEEVVATQTPSKKAKKQPVKEVEPSDDESDASEEEQEIKFEDGSDSEADEASDLVEKEAEEEENGDESESEEEEEESDDEEEPGQVKAVANESTDEDDEAPAEAPIVKKAGIPKIPVGRIPFETPKDQIIFVSNVPNEYKHIDLVALFAKFGPIAVVNRIKSKFPSSGNNVQIAFETSDAAQAALAAKEKALTLYGSVLSVTPFYSKDENDSRTIAVGLIGPSTSKEQLTKHFEKCGPIDFVNFSKNREYPTAFIRFKSEDDVAKAIKLQGSELNSRFITVRELTQKNLCPKSSQCTLLIENVERVESYKRDALEKILKKYGEIGELDLVCTTSVLAFVTYKTAEEAENAFKNLNGTSVGALTFKLKRYEHSSSPRSILVLNLAAGVTEDDLQTLFSPSGEIESIKMLHHKAVIKFTTDDGFCKSFLLNEQFVNKQPIFIEPNSNLKHKILWQKGPKPAKRSFNNVGGGAGGPPNKFKKFNNFSNNNNNRKPFNKRAA